MRFAGYQVRFTVADGVLTVCEITPEGLNHGAAQHQHFPARGRTAQLFPGGPELDYSQYALSQSIAQLEEELAVPLFDRVGKTVRLTDAGQTFLHYARTLLTTAQQAKAALQPPPRPAAPCGWPSRTACAAP